MSLRALRKLKEREGKADPKPAVPEDIESNSDDDKPAGGFAQFRYFSTRRSEAFGEEEPEEESKEEKVEETKPIKEPAEEPAKKPANESVKKETVKTTQEPEVKTEGGKKKKY